MKKLLGLLAASNQWTLDLGLLVLRLAAGGLMLARHGWEKVNNYQDFAEHVGTLGLPRPELLAPAAVGAEVAGAALLAIGLLTRLGALGLATTMGVAAFWVHRADGLARQEMALLYLALALAVFIAGPGRLSLDHLFFRK